MGKAIKQLDKLEQVKVSMEPVGGTDNDRLAAYALKKARPDLTTMELCEALKNLARQMRSAP